MRTAGALLAAAAGVQAVLVRLGGTLGSTAQERAALLPGDDIIASPDAVTNHAITIDASPEDVWPWLVQMGWHRAGWYTARWVDLLLFPANGPSATRILPDLQGLHVGDFVPDGAPETGCGFVVEQLDPRRALVLHSTSHVPAAWRERHGAVLDWSWAFVLHPLDDGRRTRFQVRSRWRTAPWWFTLVGRLAVVPADLLMSHDMLRGVRTRAEALRTSRAHARPTAVTKRSTAS